MSKAIMTGQQALATEPSRWMGSSRSWHELHRFVRIAGLLHITVLLGVN
jgi:hypothetical protein